ncbi:MAG: hypothetical protein IJ438_04045 [Clostridia bacterium]|nr:hypothetical protein [Clostridia bacterium]
MKQMNDIEAKLRQLPQMADEGLSGLKADSMLKARIERAAMGQEEKSGVKVRFTLPRWVPAACCAAAVALFIALTPMQEKPINIQTNSLGPATEAPVNLLSDLDNTDVKIVSGNNAPGYRSIWSKSSGGSFPLIGVNGTYYRMLTSPRNVSSSLMGASLGTIAEYTTEPSLSGTDVILSNKAAFGTEVYEISGMGGTLVTAEVDGAMRLFQRVSFNGNALRGSEDLEDTLQVDGRVIGLELSGVGTITDADVCQELLDILFDNASYDSSGSISSQQSLLMEIDNGLVVQMAVKNDRLAACGVWNCPEFFEAFEEACE